MAFLVLLYFNCVHTVMWLLVFCFSARGARGSSEVVAFPVILIFFISNMEFTYKYGIKKYKDMSNLLKANSWLLW